MKQMNTLLVVSLLLACAFVPGFAAADNKATDESNKMDTVDTSDSDTSTGDNETDATDDTDSSDDTAPNESAVVASKQVRKSPQVVRPQVVGSQTARMERYMNKKDRHLASRQALLDAREQFKNAETPEERAQLRHQLQTRAQEHLMLTIDQMIERLELMQEQIEAAEEQGYAPDGASENIERYILRLEGEKPEVESAETPADVVSAARNIRNTWKGIHVEIRRYTLHMIVARIGHFADKADGVSHRLEEKIRELEGEGVDTTSLETKLDDFDDKIDCARVNYVLAKDALGDGDPEDVRKAVRKANDCIRAANRILKEIFKELREYQAGAVVLDGTGTLTAEGSGTALVRGDIEMLLAADAGSLSVCDRGGDMVINITGDGTRSEEGATVVYTGFDGDATVTGSDVIVTITGSGIDLTVEGTGRAVLLGTGTYEVTHDSDVTSGNWHEAGEPPEPAFGGE
ncbi:MAG TPA: hypothetical protein EYP67_04775 [Methanosarcinales archaeon]|nr:hypothetical protein [Methanosarcinales archaeon]